MTLFELQEKIKRVLPVLIPALAVGLGGLVVYLIFFYHPPSPPLAHSAVPAQSFAWSEDGRRIYYFASGDQGAGLSSPARVLEVRKGSIVEDKVVEMGMGTVDDIAWSLGGKALASNLPSPGANPLLGIADFEGGSFTPVLLEDVSSVYALSPDGAKIAYATKPDKEGRLNLNLFSVGESRLIGEDLLGSPLKAIEQIIWDAGGEVLFIIARPGPPGAAPIMPELYLLDLEKKELKLLVSQDRDYFAFVSHGTNVLLLSSGGVDLLDLESGKITTVFEISLHPYSTRCFWLNEDWFLCRIVDHRTVPGSETLWKMNVRSLQKQRILDIPIGGVGFLFAPSPQGDQLAYIDEEGFIRTAPLK